MEEVSLTDTEDETDDEGPEITPMILLGKPLSESITGCSRKP